MKNIISLRSLTYTTTKQRLERIELDEKFRDFTEVGALLNAIACAEVDLPGQVASLVNDNGTVLLTGGLLHDAIILSKRLCDRYGKHHAVYQMDGFFHMMTDYQPPTVLVEPPRFLPFELYCKNGKSSWKLDSLDGRTKIVRRMQYGEKGIPFAVLAMPGTLGKDGFEPTLEKLLDFSTEEFAYAAEHFIDVMAKELGLEEPKEPRALKLAA